MKVEVRYFSGIESGWHLECVYPNGEGALWWFSTKPTRRQISVCKAYVRQAHKYNATH